MAMPYLPHDLLSTQILARLPFRSLMRFKCVCKAWHSTVDGDYSFAHAHVRLQSSSSSMLIVAEIKEPYSAANQVTTVSYLWEENHGTATLVHTNRDYPIFPPSRAPHDLAHCDGLVMVPTEEHVRLFNPSTGAFGTLPQRLHMDWQHGKLCDQFRGHQTFGFGHDPRSDKYKVARFFYRSLHRPSMGADYQYNLAMEVFTIGIDCQKWYETAKPPPYPIMPGRTATYFKGSLLWTVENSLLAASNTAPGFVRLRLDDESFSITQLPPCSPRPFNYLVSSLAELRGELCVAHPACNYEYLEMWMCSSLDDNPPRWDRRYIVPRINLYYGRYLRPIAMFEDEIVFRDGAYCLLRYNYRSGEGAVKDRVRMQDLRYRSRNERTEGKLVKYTREASDAFNVIPYVSSLVRDGLTIVRWKSSK